LKKPPVAKQETNLPTTKPSPEKIPGATADAAREELEQRRTILQNLKDFDFQIKKNQEEITSINEKVENLSKDLDDLVSLYEIVSEQMNPFVGLSKVTKKRLDALENIIKEVDGVKTRIGDLESNLEKNGVAIKTSTTPVPDAPSTGTTASIQPPILQKEPRSSPPIQLLTMPPSTIDTLHENDIDAILNKSLESLLMEQNIETMINEFFITLK